ncbi:MAG: hypothetical protein EOM84_01555 [Sphingobacteriia bacterium]|jgi:hypothetical protein|nr:hypothetical protein [Sphingobacteriia bacterium]
MENGNDSRPGYEYLSAYKITVPIYDLTVQFFSVFARVLPKQSKTIWDFSLAFNAILCYN